MAAVLVIIGFAAFLFRGERSSRLPWEPTRRLDASAIPIAQRYLALAYGQRDCEKANQLLDSPSAFIEKHGCGYESEPTAWVWTAPKLKRGCREAGLPFGPQGSGFDELGEFDCVRAVLTGLTCRGGLFLTRGRRDIYMARRDDGWKISHVGYSGTYSVIPSQRPCTAAEKEMVQGSR